MLLDSLCTACDVHGCLEPAAVAQTPCVSVARACAAANRLPGLQSSKQNLEKENEVYDRMMLDLIRLLVLPPLTGCSPEQGLFEVSGTLHIETPPSCHTDISKWRLPAYSDHVRDRHNHN